MIIPIIEGEIEMNDVTKRYDYQTTWQIQNIKWCS